MLAAISIPLSLMILLSLCHVSAQAPITERQALAELTAVHVERNSALERGDVEKVRSFYAPYFVLRLGNGRTLTLQDAEQLSSIVIKSPFIERKYSSVIQSVKLQGTDAILSVEQSNFEKQQLKDGSVVQIKQLIRQQETWVRDGPDWKLAMLGDMKFKQSEILVNGRKVDQFLPEAGPITPNPTDEPLLGSGHGIVFVDRMKDFTLPKAPIYCNGEKLAQMTGGSFIKVKLPPGKYSFQSDKGEPIEASVEAGKIQILSLTLEAGFPKGRGKLRGDSTTLGAQAYKLPKLLELNPLGDDNIIDKSRVVSENR